MWWGCGRGGEEGVEIMMEVVGLGFGRVWMRYEFGGLEI